MKRFIFMVTIVMSMAIMTGCGDNGESVNKNCTVFTLDEETGETIIEENKIEETIIEENISYWEDIEVNTFDENN